MLDIKKLASIATGEITLLRLDRITVRHGATMVDLNDNGHGTYYHTQACRDLGQVDQAYAEELVAGSTVRL